MRAFLLGPTAAGKTAAAVALARRTRAEILSMDSMLVYRGLDIGTAKPGPEERGGVRHHLIDLVGPDEEFSVSRWLAAARAAEAEVRRRGAPVLYVGGTGLYFKAAVAGLFDGPSVPAELRRRVEAELAAGGREALRRELAAGDPVLHARLHPHDDKRLLRGIEVLRHTGRPLSSWQRQWRRRSRIGEPAVALVRPRAEVHRRIEERFDAMLAAGLLEEVDRIRRGPGFSRSARMALGYRQLLDHLEGRCSLEEARRRAIALTRRLVRRQTTWLRSFPDLVWVEAGPAESAEDLARRLAAALRPWPGSGGNGE
ncbi:MAG: tRNA (adenosine(37)-N6)-dimethylallyltransferase MiaA [Planctomycetota bacterium]|nr:MAG: tRNA (adenosine(37)-N6)-dimethylallyltransferase MiaA [Planctomycetota bacterium]